MAKSLEALECLNKIQHNFGQLKGQELVNCFETIHNDLKKFEPINRALEICKKANEQKYVYIKETYGENDYGIVKEKFLDDLDYEVFNNRLYVNSRGMYCALPLRDYGIWWALTKEELEVK